jgi:L-iditol 2-dehydrogenase/threonine 3-dehydrogenase
MHAYTMNETGKLRLAHVADPTYGRDEILVATEAVSVCSTDISYFRGHLFPQSWPVIPGHEYVGRVVEVGASLGGRVSPGQRVTYWGQTDFGGMAELRALRPIFAGDNDGQETTWYTERNFYDADQAATVIVPDGMSASAATLVEPLTSVLRSLLVNPPKPGDTCVVLGCGPSAQLAVQVLIRYFGVRAVTALDRADARLALARRHGAQYTFNTVTDRMALEQLVSDHQDHFADYVFDALPHVASDGKGKDVRELAMGLLRPGGQYVVYGATAIPQNMNTWLILAKGLQLRATPFDVRLFPMKRSVHVAQVALTLIRSGIVDVEALVTEHITFADEEAVRQAFTSYGEGNSMKFSLLTEEAWEDPASKGPAAPAMLDAGIGLSAGPPPVQGSTT